MSVFGRTEVCAAQDTCSSATDHQPQRVSLSGHQSRAFRHYCLPCALVSKPDPLKSSGGCTCGSIVGSSESGAGVFAGLGVGTLVGRGVGDGEGDGDGDGEADDDLFTLPLKALMTALATSCEDKREERGHRTSA